MTPETEPTATPPAPAAPAAPAPAPAAPAAAPAAPAAPAAEPTADAPATGTVDWQAKSREWEKRAKENFGKATEYDKLVAASQTETERAQSDAAAARQHVDEMRSEIASAKIEAALTGVVPDPAAVVADLNLAKFVTDDGKVDAEAVTALRTKYEALAPAGNGPRTPAPTPGQGANSTPRAGQINREALDGMTPAEIVKARRDGLLNDVLGIQQ